MSVNVIPEDTLPDGADSLFKAMSVGERISHQLAAAGMNPMQAQDSDAYAPDLEMIRGADGVLYALWPTHADLSVSPFGGLRQIIEGSSWSAIETAAKLKARMDAALTDPALSPLGRREAVVSIVKTEAAPALRRLGRRWVQLREETNEIALSLARVEPYGANKPWQVHTDLEFGRSMRGLDDAARRQLATAMALGEFPDFAEAMLRLPASLTGLSAQQLARISTAVIERLNPGHGAHEAVRVAAKQAAADAITKTYKGIVSGGWLDKQEFHQLCGPELLEVLQHCGATVAELVLPLPTLTGVQALAGAAAGTGEAPL